MIDLHAHTTCSDGSMTPTQLVELAARLGLSAVAITDHDSVEGLAEGAEAGRRCGIEVVPGVEIPLEYETFTLDMLGYFLCGLPSDEFRERLVRLRKGRDERNAEILARLRDLGMDLDPAELAEIAGGEAVGRPHIGELMRRRGYVNTITEAFDNYLRRGKPAYVDRRRLSLREALRLIASSGGVASIAHPGLIRTDHGGMDRLLRESVRDGLVGLECYYPKHDDRAVYHFLELADEFRLVPTGGSDFHGDIKPDIRLGKVWRGQAVPDEALERLKARCEPAAS
jgi:3',5'-nucleoside bisphosphate phosphatase